MDHAVSVVSFERGQQQSARILSTKREVRAGRAAAAVVAGVSIAAMGGFVALTRAVGFVLHAPIFLLAWTAATGVAAGWAYRHARLRTGRFRIGASVENDGFSVETLDLVERCNDRSGYRLALSRGMSGYLDEGSVRRPIEAMVEGRQPTRLVLVADTVACIEIGTATFVVRGSDAGSPSEYPADSRPGVAPAVARARRALALPGLGIQPSMAAAMRAAPVAILLSLLAATPLPRRLRDSDLASVIPRDATPWRTEQGLRKQAQLQAESLHACFDPLPLSCQHPGYVGVGLRLAKNGDVQSSWVSRTTYGYACPVTACMEHVISGWFFDEIPEAMSVVIPVQVLQTGKPRFQFFPVKIASATSIL